MVIAEAKKVLKIPDLWKRMGLPGVPKKSCCSPFREDRMPSFSISSCGMFWRDFGTGESGDAISFIQKATGLSSKGACKKFLELVQGNRCYIPRPYPRLSSKRSQTSYPSLPGDLHQGTQCELEALSNLRHISLEGLLKASELGFLRFGTIKGYVAWFILGQPIVTSVANGTYLNAQARRLDGKPWDHLEGYPKAWTLSQSRASWPVGIHQTQGCSKILFVEGGPDLLAACHFSHDRDDIGGVAMLGASLSIPSDALPLFRGKKILFFPHVDRAGQKAVERWASQLKGYCSDIRSFDLSGLTHLQSQQVNAEIPVKDLNDCTTLSPHLSEDANSLWSAIHE